MLPSELKSRISKSQSKDWFNNLVVELNFTIVEFSQSLKGFSAIHSFFYDQVKGWEKIGTEYGSPALNQFSNDISYFKNLLSQIEQFFTSNETQAPDYLKSYWGQVNNGISNHSSRFTYNAPITLLLLKIQSNFPNSSLAAYNFITQNQIPTNSKDGFIGVMLVYEFLMKDRSNIANRRDLEKPSLNKLKSDFANLLSESDKQLIEHLSNASKDYSEYVKTIDDFKLEKETLFQEWYSKSQKEFDTFSQNVNTKMQDFEHRYGEKLKLAKPAEFWSKRAFKLKQEGWTALKWLVGLVVFACISLFFLLWLTPDAMLLSFIDAPATAIKWSIVYVTFISFLAFGIRALSRIVFSSFHLARDAEEREQLVYVYLALIADSSIDPSDRNLVFQSLFSRADTGLLKEDSSPTMPNDIVSKIVTKPN